jgi:DNA-binding MarR family transcriptional regulator
VTTSPPTADPRTGRTAAALDAFATWAVRTTATRDLSLTTASTLATLDRSGPVRLSDLATREGVTQPSMTALVSRLERDGLAERSGDPHDRRAVNVVITERGRTALADRRARRAGVLAALLDRAEPDDRALIEAAAPALARLIAAGPAPAASTPTPEQETAS